MESRGKKRFFNVIMVLLILVIAVSGVVTVGKIQGWFDKPEAAVMTAGKIKGIANIERKGIGYTLNSDTVLQSGDVIETKKSAQAELLIKELGSFILNGNTEAVLAACEEEHLAIQVEQGELFGDAADYSKELEVSFGENKAKLSASVFMVSAQKGSSTLYVYAGDVSVALSDGTTERVEAGEYLSVVTETDGTLSYTIDKLQKDALSEFQISQLQNCKSADELCFTMEELQAVLDSREAEKQAALEASLNAERIAKENTEDSTEEESSMEEDSQEDGTSSEEQAGQSTVEEYVSGSSGSDSQETVSTAKVCTITIRCDTILNNMVNLDNGKEVYVPANGTILATSSVEFEDGETVFDVLNRVCQYAGIQIEYSWTPMYNSYYIEGINNLYEFDCGNESGWMYKVNGWFPNYGCSSYYLEDGDNIVWCYTCNGLGADVGAPAY